MQAFPEEGAETVVSLDGVNEEGIAAGFGFVKDVEEGGSGGLLLVGNVRVPRYRAGAVGEKLVDRVVACAAVDEVDFWEAFWGAGGGVDVMAGDLVSVG